MSPTSKQDTSALRFFSRCLTLLVTLALTGCGAGTFTPPGGTYAQPQSVAINHPYASDIYYTLDGSTPNTRSHRYTQPIVISTSTTIKALPIINGKPGDIFSASYRIIGGDSGDNGSGGPSETISIPAKIEAENYIDYHDTTAGNEGGAYRNDDVDIERCYDTGGGYNVGWVAPGEYIRFKIRVPQTDSYVLRSRVATIKNNRSFRFRLDGRFIGDTVYVPNTGKWQKYTDAPITVKLTRGVHTLDVYFDNEELNLNYIDIQKADSTDTDPSGWKLIWRDEFNGTSIDSSKWELAHNGKGGGNNELQYYTPRRKNAYVENGRLIIQALREQYSGSDGTRNYTSARLSTPNKGDFRYGKIEVRAKLPAGQGLWPAIWMLPTDWKYGGWAASGEIDIMEAINLQGAGGNKVYGTLHYGGKWPDNTHKGKSYTPSTSVVNNFHTYSIEWEPNEIRWYVDGIHYQTQTDWWSAAAGYPAPFDQRFHIILNVAVGGNWPGSPNSSTRFPQTMEVDYVRVYEKR